MSDLTDVTRKLVAVFAADVEGYSRLMGADEVGTARTLREHRKVTDALVAKHGGRIVTTSVGLIAGRRSAFACGPQRTPSLTYHVPCR